MYRALKRNGCAVYVGTPQEIARVYRRLIGAPVIMRAGFFSRPYAVLVQTPHDSEDVAFYISAETGRVAAVLADCGNFVAENGSEYVMIDGSESRSELVSKCDYILANLAPWAERADRQRWEDTFGRVPYYDYEDQLMEEGGRLV